MDIIKALNWRYATKKMTGEIIPDEIINRIIEAAWLAPSGIGLQPYEIIVVTNPEWKARIRPIAFNQPQVTESSHLLIFAAWDTYSKARIDEVFDYLNTQRDQPASASDGQRNFAISYFGKMTDEENFHHAAKQANIALGLSVVSAALEKIDATPMEGFNAAALDKLLDLRSKGLRSSMLLALGYRDEKNDWNLKLKKVRKPLSSFLTQL